MADQVKKPRHQKTDRRLTKQTTIERRDMPARVSGPSELRLLSGTSGARVPRKRPRRGAAR